jgi:hypothetical protein
MEAFEGIVKRIVNALNGAKVKYTLTGALAASHYGLPRTTTDIGIIVKVFRKDVQTKLVSALRKAELWVDEKKIDAALKSSFRIVTFNDTKSPFTVDIIFSLRKLKKKAGTVLGLPTFYQTPEELILAKLRMIKATIPKERALKDEDDVKAILKFTKVDKNAIKKQAKRNKTLSILKTMMHQSIS